MQKNSVNKAIIVGRLGQKPELKYTLAQVAVTNISVATTEKIKDRDDSTEWHKVTAFGKTAEFVANYLDKGALIYVDGRIQTRSWEDRDGVKKYTTEIIANTVTPLGGVKAVDPNSQPEPKPEVNGNTDDSELPF
jgi:single-strand DNA-binding protein